MFSTLNSLIALENHSHGKFKSIKIEKNVTHESFSNKKSHFQVTTLGICHSFLEGLFDSLRNIFVIFYLDREMNKKLGENITTTDTTKKSNKEKK